jgi:hypothetical protein
MLKSFGSNLYEDLIQMAQIYIHIMTWGSTRSKVCLITRRFDDSGIASAIIKFMDIFCCGKLLKAHEMPVAEILEIDAMRIYNH